MAAGCVGLVWEAGAGGGAGRAGGGGGGWWGKAYAVLFGMKERGLHVSPEDEDILRRLREKVGA